MNNAADRVRKAEIERNTRETQIKLCLNLDGSGEGNISTGIGFQGDRTSKNRSNVPIPPLAVA